MRLAYRCVFLVTAFCAAALGVAAPASDPEYSHARIVRLSYVEGTVTVARPDSTDWSNAPVNTPIQEGFRLATAASSFAEVQFENGSTARLGEQSQLDFTQLGLTEAGDSINRLTLEQGYATFHFFPAHADTYEVMAGNTTLRAGVKSEFRADLDSDRLRVKVFKGDVAYTATQGSGTLSKNKTLEISSDVVEARISRGVRRDDWDDWVAGRDQEQETDSQRPGLNRSDSIGTPTYGWSDLNQYGVWSDYPGYGYGWAPSIASLGPWSPFSYGQWVWYPSFGYTWIGYEPWGWLPYHYGSWFFDPFAGWFWIPGAFSFWNPAPVNWYVGGGLVGWCPAGANTAGGATAAAGSGSGSRSGKPPVEGRACTPGQPGCLVAVPIRNLAKGTPVQPGELAALDLVEATKVAQPDVPPTALGMLPGTPAAAPVVARSQSGHGGSPSPAALALRSSGAASHAAPPRSLASRGNSSGEWHVRRAPSSASAESRAGWAHPGGSASSAGNWSAESRSLGNARSSAGAEAGMSSSSHASSASSSGGSHSSGPPHH